MAIRQTVAGELPLLPATQDRAFAPVPRATRPLRVSLVNMPWARVDAPSIQCGLLKAIAREAGHHCDVHYLNLDLAEVLGGAVYEAVAGLRGERMHLFGEWLFSYAAFGDITREDDYFTDCPETKSIWADVTGSDLADLVSVRRELLPGWIAGCAERIGTQHYDVIGFSSTFLQNTACLALGRALKDRWPEVAQVYGGANFDGEMGIEYARGVPWLDYVVVGEGDIAFPALLARIANGGGPPIPGVYQRGSADQGREDAPRPDELDVLPVPQYGDYFAALERHDRRRVLGHKRVRLPVEFSRGCWWGHKHHCTFCGLNALGMRFRAKSDARALDELNRLLSEYPSVHPEAVDNILDMNYLTSVCTELAKRHWDINMFFEVKANLDREHLATLQRAGVLRLQPGIESLSTNVLGLMGKGSSRLLNVRFLKWARYFGIHVTWNMLAGFPGETDEDYIDQAQLIPLLFHLQPPSGCDRIWLERFSPYFTNDNYAISNICPQPSYRHVYPDWLDHAKIAYFFDYEATSVCSPEVLDRVSASIDTWKQHAREGASLIYQRLPGRVTIIDKRTSQPRRMALEGWRADAYEACGDTLHTAPAVARKLTDAGHSVSDAAVEEMLDRCCKAGVMLGEQGRYLSLALPENPGW